MREAMPRPGGTVLGPPCEVREFVVHRRRQKNGILSSGGAGTYDTTQRWPQGWEAMRERRGDRDRPRLRGGERPAEVRGVLRPRDARPGVSQGRWHYRRRTAPL